MPFLLLFCFLLFTQTDSNKFSRLAAIFAAGGRLSRLLRGLISVDTARSPGVVIYEHVSSGRRLKHPVVNLNEHTELAYYHNY